MKIVVFGLAMSSSWGNGHATLWRGLTKALGRRGHRTVFFEHDAPYYAMNRDAVELLGTELVLYPEWEEARARAARELADADVAIVTSYCPHGIEATELVLDQPRALRVFYDLDTPVTLACLHDGGTTSYIGPRGLADFDLVLSFTGGRALEELRTRLGAFHVATLYGHVDPEVHRPSEPLARFAADLSYLGTYAADRQVGVNELLVAAAWCRQDHRFLIGGAQYPADFPWAPNIYFVRHLPPAQHPAFFSSSRLTLNITRRAMAEMGWCPSGRLFEAAACGAPILTDMWDGLDAFFAPDEEVLPAWSRDDVVGALDLGEAALTLLASRARERVLAEHTSDRRAIDFERALERAPVAPAQVALEV